MLCISTDRKLWKPLMKSLTKCNLFSVWKLKGKSKGMSLWLRNQLAPGGDGNFVVGNARVKFEIQIIGDLWNWNFCCVFEDGKNVTMTEKCIGMGTEKPKRLLINVLTSTLYVAATLGDWIDEDLSIVWALMVASKLCNATILSWWGSSKSWIGSS